MIRNKEDLLNFLNEDKRALGKSCKKMPRLFGDDVWKFEIVLRKHEYYSNITPTIRTKIMKKIYGYLHRKLGIKLGFSIPINVFGPGLRINHYGLIVVNDDARIGANCDIHQGVNIGQNRYKGDVPTIGDNVWIGPGAKIFGKITIANSIAIGANSVVNKSFFEENITIVGNPIRKVKNTGTN
ncbi:serine acetyltransferase [Neobacillus sp. MER 74]|uniref:serine O-acetyltransferase n=1 Tax=Neobacillus sp. MER 74 TaxID=2939566 RepID=UPI00203F0039|nr:serine acetyltransferase [Neobacillus sp. MER 74]MCM3118458.1 serine acetyltransferase [Neobacillus sp. MER 74]